MKETASHSSGADLLIETQQFQQQQHLDHCALHAATREPSPVTAPTMAALPASKWTLSLSSTPPTLGVFSWNRPLSANRCSFSSSSDDDWSASVDLQEEQLHQLTDREAPAGRAWQQHPAFVTAHQRRHGVSLEGSPELLIQHAPRMHAVPEYSIHQDDGFPADQQPFSRSVRNSQSSARVSAQTGRSLLLLFLVALYTTFGLTSPNLPRVESMQFEMSVERPHNEAVATPSRTMLRTKPTARFSYARGNQGVLTFRRKEMSDFYHQQAIRTSSDVSWYINCAALTAIAFWAWRERRPRQRVATGTSLQS